MDANPLVQLRSFALKAVAAEKFPAAHHRCRSPSCPACGAVPLEITVEEHSGTRKGDFRGVIYGRCPQCGSETSIFRFTGPQRKVGAVRRLTCTCEQDRFWVTICERIEGDDGLPGFFDEGVVAGQCAACGCQQIIASFD